MNENARGTVMLLINGDKTTVHCTYQCTEVNTIYGFFLFKFKF